MAGRKYIKESGGSRSTTSSSSSGGGGGALKMIGRSITASYSLSE